MLITGWPNSVLRLTRKSSVKVATIVVLLAPVLLTVACGGANSNPPAPLPVSVQVTPPTSSMVVGESRTFAAVVKNSTAGVKWSVQEGATGGSVTSAGVYTAPMKSSTYHVIATSITDPTKSASGTVGVTAPAPAFTSTAPAAANEGDVYTYALTATDPVKTAITFSLASGPDGATLTGSTLTWTPTHVQSRASNAFKVSALTSAGGSAAQNFSVTPLGTIRGWAIDTYVTAQGNVSDPEDLSTIYVGASVPDGSAWKTIDGVTNPDGTFEIHKVPAGNYWLAAASGGYWTSASDIDLGQTFLGRNNGVLPTTPTSMALAFTGLQSWGLEDSIQIFNPNLSQSFDWSDNNNPGDTASAELWDWTEPLSDAALGDAWYVTQVSKKEVGATSWHYLAKSAPAISITQTDGSTTDLAGVLADPTQITMHLRIMGSQFAALAPAVGLDAEVHSTSLGVYSQPFTASKGWIGFVQTLLESDGQEPITTDVDAGDVTFGNPFPAEWVPFVSLGYQLTVPYQASGAMNGVDVPAEIYISMADLSTDKPLAPVLTPVRNVKLNGTALTQAQSTATLSPNLAWDLPTTGIPTGYRVTVYQLSLTGFLGKNSVSAKPSSQTSYQPILDLFTKSARITIPDGVLAAGNEYFFAIRSYLAPGVDFTVAPYRTGFPWAHTDMLTAVVSTGANALPKKAAANAMQHLARPSMDQTRPRPGSVKGRVLKAMPHQVAP